LDEVVLHARRGSGAEDRGPIQAAVAHLLERGARDAFIKTMLGAARHVLQVEQRDASTELLYEAGGIAAGYRNPKAIDLESDEFLVGIVDQNLKQRGLARRGRFEGVIVIR